MAAPMHPPAPTGFFPPDFVAAVLADALAHGSRLYAVAGLQGSGKSTLAAQLVAHAAAQGLQAVAVSIDDFYLDRERRLRLARDVHPLLATRGPPGTHDVANAAETLFGLRNGYPCVLPRFDKIADDPLPVSEWAAVHGYDLAIVEGWFLKTPPQAASELVAPVNALECDEDAEGVWRRYCNQALARDYPLVWAQIDRLLWLHGPGFDTVPEWRWQQEQALQRSEPDRDAMSRPQVERFVQYFERVSRQAWRTLPAIADWTVPLDAERRPGGLWERL